MLLLPPAPSHTAHTRPHLAHGVSEVRAKEAVDGKVRRGVHDEQKVGPLVPVAERDRRSLRVVAERVQQVHEQVGHLTSDKQEHDRDEHERDVELVALAQAQLELAAAGANERQHQEGVHDGEEGERHRVRHHRRETHVHEEAVVPPLRQLRHVQVDAMLVVVVVALLRLDHHHVGVVLEPEGQTDEEAEGEDGGDDAEGGLTRRRRVVVALHGAPVHNRAAVHARTHGHVDRAELKRGAQRIQVRKRERVELVVEERAVADEQVPERDEEEQGAEGEQVGHGQAGQEHVGRVGAHARLQEDAYDERVARDAHHAHDERDPAEQDVLVAREAREGRVVVRRRARRQRVVVPARRRRVGHVGQQRVGRRHEAKLEHVARLEHQVKVQSAVHHLFFLFSLFVVSLL